MEDNPGVGDDPAEHYHHHMGSVGSGRQRGPFENHRGFMPSTNAQYDLVSDFVSAPATVNDRLVLHQIASSPIIQNNRNAVQQQITHHEHDFDIDIDLGQINAEVSRARSSKPSTHLNLINDLGWNGSVNSQALPHNNSQWVACPYFRSGPGKYRDKDSACKHHFNRVRLREHLLRHHVVYEHDCECGLKYWARKSRTGKTVKHQPDEGTRYNSPSDVFKDCGRNHTVDEKLFVGEDKFDKLFNEELPQQIREAEDQDCAWNEEQKWKFIYYRLIPGTQRGQEPPSKYLTMSEYDYMVLQVAQERASSGFNADVTASFAQGQELTPELLTKIFEHWTKDLPKVPLRDALLLRENKPLPGAHVNVDEPAGGYEPADEPSTANTATSVAFSFDGGSTSGRFDDFGSSNVGSNTTLPSVSSGRRTRKKPRIDPQNG